MQSYLYEITSDEDVIDSRNVIARIEHLEEMRDADEITEDEAAELGALVALAEAGETLPDWEYGVTLVRDSYFTQYAEQLAEELGLLGEQQWPANHIDWESAAEELQHDYTSLTFDGVHYWAR